VNVTSSGVLIILSSNTPSNATVKVSNLSSIIPIPEGYNKLVIINFTIEGPLGLSSEMIIHYPCSIQNTSEIVPYAIENGTWTQIQYYLQQPSQCDVSFTPPSLSTTVALFVRSESPGQQAVREQGVPSWYYYAAAAVVIVIVIVVAAYMLLKRSQKKPGDRS
jgi:hypothetical protein